MLEPAQALLVVGAVVAGAVAGGEASYDWDASCAAGVGADDGDGVDAAGGVASPSADVAAAMVVEASSCFLPLLKFWIWMDCFGCCVVVIEAGAVGANGGIVL